MSSSDPSRREVLAATTLTAAAAIGGLSLSAAANAASQGSVPAVLIQRLKDHGVETFFGVPGATCAPLFDAAVAADMPVVVTSSDIEAGYAAEASARLRGLSVVSVSYGVGTMGLLSVVAGALAERVPMMIVNGGPSGKDLRLQAEEATLYSHSCTHENADLALFAEVTAAAIRVERAADAGSEIDRAIQIALTERRPVYLEIAKHLWWSSCTRPEGSLHPTPGSTPHDRAAADTILARLKSARRPLALVGVEVQRLGLQDAAQALITSLGLPWASTLLGKTTLAEQTPGFLGVYMGRNSVPAMRTAVEQSDCVLALGTIMGRQFRTLVTERKTHLARLEDGHARLFGAQRSPAALAGTMRILAESGYRAPAWSRPLSDPSFAGRRASIVPRAPTPVNAAEPGLHYDDVMGAVSGLLDEGFVVIGDTSLSMYPAAELDTKGRGAFVCNGVWQAIGYSVPAALGVGLSGSRRPIAICGDGGFQMTCMALSTLAREGVPAIVIVLDNAMYGIEQWLLRRRWYAEQRPTEPLSYLTLPRWNYDEVGRGMGCELVRTVERPEALAAALAAALRATGPSLITARIRPHDLPEELRT